MNVDTTPALEKRFQDLEEKVANYTGHTFSTIARSVNSIYVVIPIAIAAILSVLKPNFLYIQTLDGRSRYFSYKKYVVSWMLLSTVACVGYYAYRYKKM